MKNFTFGILFFLFCNIGWAGINLKIEPSDIQEGDVFKLTLTLDGKTASYSPNLNALEQDFTIVGTQRSQSYSFINGRTENKSQWFVLLIPKRAGTLTIPAFRIGNETSLARTIQVKSALVDSTKFDQIRQDLMLLTEVSEKKPYLNQQLIYTVKFYNSRQLINIAYQPPTAEDALLIPIGNVSQGYQTFQNGQAYTVEEQKYAVFPQRSGRLKIQPPTLQVFIEDGGAKKIILKGKPLFLNVKPIPNQYTGSNWLPAKAVSLTEHYNNQASSIKKGSTLTREIKIEATALPGQLLPQLELSTKQNISAYPEQAIEKSRFQQGDIIGSSTTKVTYLFNEEGESTLPELRLVWFNLKTFKEYIVIFPERKIQVLPTSGNTASPNVNLPSTVALHKSKPNLKDPAPISQKIDSFVRHLDQSFWMILIEIVLITLLVWSGFFISRRKKQSLCSLDETVQANSTKNQRNTTPVNNGCNSSLKMKSVLHSLEKACQGNQTNEAKQSLLQWASLQWPNISFLSLADIVKQCFDAELEQQIIVLQQALYSRAHHWEGVKLWQCIEHYQNQKPNPKKKKKINQLPEMHHL